MSFAKITYKNMLMYMSILAIVFLLSTLYFSYKYYTVIKIINSNNVSINIHHKSNLTEWRTLSANTRKNIVVSVFSHFPTISSTGNNNTWYQVDSYLKTRYKTSLPLIVFAPFILKEKTPFNFIINKLISLKKQVKADVEKMSMKDIKQYWHLSSLNGQSKWQTYLSILEKEALKRWPESIVNAIIKQMN